MCPMCLLLGTHKAQNLLVRILHFLEHISNFGGGIIFYLVFSVDGVRGPTEKNVKKKHKQLMKNRTTCHFLFEKSRNAEYNSTSALH